MSLQVFNSFSGKKEEFYPVNPPQVKMYVCGITPYDETHLGHARAYVVFDLIRRFLEELGYEVLYVQNFTDIDDKIIHKANMEVKKFNEVAEQFTISYFEVMDRLNVRRADLYPKATEHIGEMVRWIEGLLEKGVAYIIDGDVYFEVEKFPAYGKLSKREKKDMQAGARVEIDERKKNPLDFALWKKAKEGEPSWDSPWGTGRPGWHIECTAMSIKYLGMRFDIHGGGMDLEFPHHENEIAQSEALTGVVPWVKYWLHNGFVTVNRQKMSKSLGNFFTLKDIFKKYDPMVVRYFLLSTHYRSPVNYSNVELDAAKEAYGRIVRFVNDVDFILSKAIEGEGAEELGDLEEEASKYKAKFYNSLNDDFNSAGAIAAIFDMIHFCNKVIEEGEVEMNNLEIMRNEIVHLCHVLGLEISGKREEGLDVQEIEHLIAERESARKMKDFRKADKIRIGLMEKGIILEDTVYGTRWVKNA